MKDCVWSIENFQNAKWLSGKGGCPAVHFIPPPTLSSLFSFILTATLTRRFLFTLRQLTHMKLGGATPYLRTPPSFPKLEVRVDGVAPGQTEANAC